MKEFFKYIFQFSNVTLLKSKSLQLGTLTVRCTRKIRKTVLKSVDIPIPLYSDIINVLVRTIYFSPHRTIQNVSYNTKRSKFVSTFSILVSTNTLPRKT